MVAIAAGRVLAASFAVLPRPDLEQAVGRPPRGGFAIGWHLFDPTIVAALAAVEPEAEVIVGSPGNRVLLSTLPTPLSVAALLTAMRSAPRDQWRRFPLVDGYEALAGHALMDAEWYRARAPDLPADEDPLLDYLEHGEAACRSPNRYFDPELVAEALDLAEPAGALLTYLARPDAVARTSIHFDQDWYVGAHAVPGSEIPLAWHLREPAAREPNPTLRLAELLARYPQAAAARDPYAAAFDMAERADEAAPLLARLRAASPTPLFGGPVRPGFHLRRVMVQAGLFDAAHYLVQAPEGAAAPGGPAGHFADVGDRRFASPHPWFDPAFYCRAELRGIPAEGALCHYLSAGERAGLRPSPLFETRWYQDTFGPDPTEGGALAHYLRHRCGNRHAPNRWVDLSSYLERHPELRGRDAFEDWMTRGAAAGEVISARFDAGHVQRRYLQGAPARNPLAAFLEFGGELGWSPLPEAVADRADLFDAVARATQPAPWAERAAPSAAPPPRALAFALLLPSNDLQAGADRLALARSLPRVTGQRQPRIPSWSLERAADPEAARAAGLAGFLLPVPAAFGDLPRSPSFRFLPLWSDGRDPWLAGRIPQAPTRPDGEPPPELLQALADGRCLRIADRPVLILGDAALAGGHVEALRSQLSRAAGPPWLLVAQPMDRGDPRAAGFDGAVEIPLHRGEVVPTHAPLLEELLDPAARPRLASYEKVLAIALGRPRPAWPLLRCAVPDWDESPRNGLAALLFRGATPAAFGDWLRALVEQSEETPLGEQRLVLIDGWNAWQDGAALLPDVTGGHALLNATARALAAPPSPRPALRLAVLGGPDDASSAAARGIAAALHRHFGVPSALVLGAGALLSLEPAEGTSLPPDLPPGRASPTVVAGWLAAAGVSTVLDLAAAPATGQALSRAGLRQVVATADLRAAGPAAIPDAAAPMASALLDLVMPGRLRISVVVPSWRSAAWLGARMASIFAQTATVEEVVLLDDASDDDSIAVARAAADRAGRALRVVTCPRNSGNVFRQWHRAVELATGDLLWIAEADDTADPRFLVSLATRLAADPDGILAFCDSGAIGPDGRLLAADRKPYASALGEHGLARDGRFAAAEFARRFLSPRNLVLTASAVLWRRDRLRAAFDALGERAFAFSVAGDWQLYLAACRAGGAVHYLAEPLARQRHHPDSASAQLDKARHLAEVAAIHDLIRDGDSSDETRQAMAQHRRDLEQAWFRSDRCGVLWS